MAATVITVQQLISPFPATPLTASSADIVFTALTVTEGDTFVCTGREVILIKNGTGTNTLTISSADEEGLRTLPVIQSEPVCLLYLGLDLPMPLDIKHPPDLLK
jgi:hypothetical protein